MATRPSHGLRRVNYLYVPVGLLLLWEGIGRLGMAVPSLQEIGIFNPTLLPPPSRVGVVWFDVITGATKEAGPYTRTWAHHAVASLWRVYLGFVIAIAVGTTMGLLIGLSRGVERLLDPTVQLFRNVPVTAWLPISMVLFGIADRPAIFLIALGAFFPTVVNTAAGVRQVDRTLVKAGLMMGVTRYQLVRRIIFPASLPSVMTGFRLSMGVAWVLVVVAEMVAVKSGLGYLLQDSRLFFRNDVLVAAMLSIGVLGFLSDVLLLAIRNRALRWTRLVTYSG